MTVQRNFKRIEPAPEEAIERVVEILRSGDCFRYSGDPAESEALLLERDFLKDWGGGARFALAVNSCSSAMLLVLKGLGIGPGQSVLVPAFTFTAVPSSIENLYARPILVECGRDFKVDLEDLEAKMEAHPEARVFLLSHMRGYISDMDAILALCTRRGITLVEDAAHALGARWKGKQIGTFGKAACYSFQNYKIINAGEGGMIVTDDEELFVKMVFDQGAYEKLYEKHFVRSPHFTECLNRRPLFNMRLSNIHAAIARAQLPYVEERIRRYGEVYEAIYRGLVASERVEFPATDAREERVFDSIQFRLKGFTPEMMEAFIGFVRGRGVPLDAFSTDQNARAPWNWKYIDGRGEFPKTHAALDTACDMRITVTMTDEDCAYLVETVLAGIESTTAQFAEVAAD